MRFQHPQKGKKIKTTTKRHRERSSVTVVLEFSYDTNSSRAGETPWA